MGLENIFKVTESKSVLTEHARSNPFFDVLVHKVYFPATGAPPAEFYTVEHKFFACSAVCIDQNDRVLLVRVPRFSLRNVSGDEYSWELPGGRSQDSEMPLECIIREVREETGLIADSFELLLKDYYYPESSFGTERLYLFWAHNVRKKANKTPETEGTFELSWFDFNKAVEMIFKGEIRSSWTIIGLLTAKIRREEAKK